MDQVFRAYRHYLLVTTAFHDASRLMSIVKNLVAEMYRIRQLRASLSRTTTG